MVPLKLTMVSVQPRPDSGVADVNLTVTVRVCSTTKAIDPLGAAINVSLSTSTVDSVRASTDWDLPDPFYDTLGPHSCLSGDVGYDLPAGATPRSLEFDSFVADNVVWDIG